MNLSFFEQNKDLQGNLILEKSKVITMLLLHIFLPSFQTPLTEHSLARSVYSREERTLLGWLSHHYETQRTVIWGKNPPPTRWIVSFDNDLLDGLVLAALLSSYCPFLVSLC